MIELNCAISNEIIHGKPYEEVVEIARNYINVLVGFESLLNEDLFKR